MSKPTGKLIRVTTASIGAVPVGRKVNNKPLSADVSLSAGDVGAYSKTETDNKVADAKKAGTDAQTKANAANTAATNANNNANGRVPSSRKVNGKPLTSDITLGAGDVGTYTKQEIDAKASAGSGLGYGQTWKDVKSSRALSTTYTNSTGKPILVSISPNGARDHYMGFDCFINNVKVAVSVGFGGESKPQLCFIVPHSSTYKIEYSANVTKNGINMWTELRS